jgi:hypothetical protein
MVGFYASANTGAGFNVYIPNTGVTVPSNKLVYLCGFNVNGLGATALTNVLVQIFGIQRGDGVQATPAWSYQYPAGATANAVPITMTFTPCLAAVAPGAGINIFVPSAAGNTQTNIALWGYAL